MLYRASAQFARERGGSITRWFLDSLRREFGENDLDGLVIDSRTHMLMRGWFPCVPGWHHDDVPRDTPSGQPNYDRPRYHAKHAAMVLDAGAGSLTEFLSGVVDVPWPVPESANVYGAWDAYLNTLTFPANLRRETVEPGRIVLFDAHTFHRGMPATGAGWRYFIRATWGVDYGPQNKLRRNANVYLPAVSAGW